MAVTDTRQSVLTIKRAGRTEKVRILINGITLPDTKLKDGVDINRRGGERTETVVFHGNFLRQPTVGEAIKNLSNAALGLCRAITRKAKRAI